MDVPWVFFESKALLINNLLFVILGLDPGIHPSVPPLGKGRAGWGLDSRLRGNVKIVKLFPNSA